MNFPGCQGQLTLVALFGDKKKQFPELWNLLEELQYAIENSLGKENFCRYQEALVHGTIIGLEGGRDGEIIWNKNYHELLGEHSSMNIIGVVDFIVNNNPTLPISIKIGGFKENLSYPFTSRGHTPYFRSFSIQGKIAVAMGWPVKNNLYTSEIDHFRRSFNQFNVLHKYHNSATAYDNDFFFVLGNITQSLSDTQINRCQNQMREILACCDIPLLQITKNQLSIVAYPEGDTQFKRATVINMEEAKNKIDELERFYTPITPKY